MSLTAEAKSAIVKEFGGTEKNTGSIEVQIALLTARIKDLTEHFKVNKKDKHSRRGLELMVSRRRKLLNYIKNTKLEQYRKLIVKLGLRR